MIDTNESFLLCLGALWLQHTQIGKGESVVLVVIRKESERGVLMLHLRAEDLRIPTQYLLETAGSVNDVREFLWSNAVHNFLRLGNDVA